jgi:hypothetical protein
MKFARIVFMFAGVWGIVVLIPFYWLVDITGRYSPPTEYPPCRIVCSVCFSTWRSSRLGDCRERISQTGIFERGRRSGEMCRFTHVTARI